MTQPKPISTIDYGDVRVFERPDGFYYQDKRTNKELGPFATLVEAVASIDDTTDTELESGEDLTEVENELGIADWIDPDTGAPAEESVPHIEDN